MVRDLRASHGITVDILKAADRPIRDQIRPRSRLRFLEEIYNIREAEERLLSRQTGNALFSVIVIHEANFFHTDKQPVKQTSCQDVLNKLKRASTSGLSGCTDIDQNSTKSMGAFVSDWAHVSDENASLTSFTHYGTLPHLTTRQGENRQDHRKSLSYPDQPAVPFQVTPSQWELGPLEASSCMGVTDYPCQSPYWSEGANALTQREQYKAAHYVPASGPLAYTMAGTGRLPQSNGMYWS
jgi:hypothetical protein